MRRAKAVTKQSPPLRGVRRTGETSGSPWASRRTPAEGGYWAESLLVCLSVLVSLPALAACPQELAIYEDTAGNSLTFVPPHATQAAEHEFTLRIGAKELQGIVMWSKEPDRPNGIVMDSCPDGDVTGEELNACTVWQGVIYGLTKDANAPFIGKRDTPHAEALLLPDLSRYAMEHVYKTPLAGPPKVDDVFRMKACQE